MRIRIPARRMQDGAVDAGRIHVPQRLVEQIGRRAMRGDDVALGPQVDLGIDDVHGGAPRSSDMKTGRVVKGTKG